jgi:dephospho-CoA kinase
MNKKDENNLQESPVNTDMATLKAILEELLGKDPSFKAKFDKVTEDIIKQLITDQVEGAVRQQNISNIDMEAEQFAKAASKED